MRLIDADALRTAIEEGLVSKVPKMWERGIQFAINRVINAPTVDPVKHGHWIAHDMSIKDVPTEACSECGEWSYGYNETYCQKCGAKMDEVEE